MGLYHCISSDIPPGKCAWIGASNHGIWYIPATGELRWVTVPPDLRRPQTEESPSGSLLNTTYTNFIDGTVTSFVLQCN